MTAARQPAVQQVGHGRQAEDEDQGEIHATRRPVGAPGHPNRSQRAQLGEAVRPADGGLQLARLEVDHQPQMERQVDAQDGPPEQAGGEEPAGLRDAGKSEGDSRRDQNRDANQRAETQP